MTHTPMFQPRHTKTDHKPTLGWPDRSIPDLEDHDKHLRTVAAASRFGFPFCVKRAA